MSDILYGGRDFAYYVNDRHGYADRMKEEFERRAAMLEAVKDPRLDAALDRQRQENEAFLKNDAILSEIADAKRGDINFGTAATYLQEEERARFELQSSTAMARLQQAAGIDDPATFRNIEDAEPHQAYASRAYQKLDFEDRSRVEKAFHEKADLTRRAEQPQQERPTQAVQPQQERQSGREAFNAQVRDPANAKAAEDLKAKNLASFEAIVNSSETMQRTFRSDETRKLAIRKEGQPLQDKVAAAYNNEAVQKAKAEGATGGTLELARQREIEKMLSAEKAQAVDRLKSANDERLKGMTIADRQRVGSMAMNSNGMKEAEAKGLSGADRDLVQQRELSRATKAVASERQQKTADRGEAQDRQLSKLNESVARRDQAQTKDQTQTKPKGFSLDGKIGQGSKATEKGQSDDGHDRPAASDPRDRQLSALDKSLNRDNPTKSSFRLKMEEKAQGQGQGQ